MMRTERTLLLLLVTGIVACASATKDIAVESEVGPASDFSGYRTYDWTTATTVLNDPEGHWSAPGFNAVEFMVAQVDSALQKRGLTRQTTEPDLLASIGTGINMEYTDSATMANVPKGALVLVLVDNASGNLAWMGTATGNVQDNPDDDTMRKRLAHAVSEMMKQMPK
jgi:hypothetical protein